ncbi:hypothetical protein NHE_0317 [Neorickettsia helminthoeca str. Oregon]|uniref:Uncharacterized protein n=1 Tax=Neorickettsia helminthoeca str. Oregon TaxID=1286528 RepID=X5HLJ5_9RICK|nr:hypothetical protein [Neorickettsia helminthoeca]AHX11275.1 hypothetical protein NHE_0317 [Neorickettsia helminthoeca str. Oregon]
MLNPLPKIEEEVSSSSAELQSRILQLASDIGLHQNLNEEAFKVQSLGNPKGVGTGVENRR